MTKRSLTAEELAIAAYNLATEIRQMSEFHELTVKYNIDGPPLVRGACLEAMLSRARFLVEFLAGRPGRRDTRDVHPTDFVQQWEPSPHLREMLADIDAYVAHFTILRATAPTGKWWNIDDIGAVLDEFERFTAVAEQEPGNPFGPTFRDGLTLARAAMRRTDGLRLPIPPFRSWPRLSGIQDS